MKLPRYVVGYATRDGNTHEFRRVHRLSMALRLAEQFQARHGSAVATFVYDDDNPERGELSELDLEG